MDGRHGLQELVGANGIKKECALAAVLMLGAWPAGVDAGSGNELMEVCDGGMTGEPATDATINNACLAYYRNLQSCLAYLGYYGGEIDGNWGEEPEAALAAARSEILVSRWRWYPNVWAVCFDHGWMPPK